MSSTASTFRTAEPQLKELLSQIDLGRVQLPDFQRPWVWDDVHIRELIASVSLAYPIGAIMLMETGGEGARFKPHPVEGSQVPATVVPEKLILDGQQRLTSLYLALRSGRPVPTRTEQHKAIERVYYLDVKGCLNPDVDRGDAVVSLPPDRILRSDFGRKVDLDASTPEREYELGLFPLSAILDSGKAIAWFSACKAHFGQDPEKSQMIDRFQMQVWLVFEQYKLPVIELLQGTPKEAVCQVFEKVNTGGVALTVFELMTATFAADEFELRKDWERRQQRLADHNQKVLAEFDATDLLTSVTLLATYCRSQKDGAGVVSCKRKDVLRLPLEEYKRHADAIEKGLLNAARLLARLKVFNAYNLPYKSQLVPLAAICAFLGNDFEQDTVKQKLARWYWCGVFGELYGGANEGRFAWDIQDVVTWIRGGDEPRTIRDANFAPTRLLTLQTRQAAAYKGVMALLMEKGSLDFLSGDSIEVNSFFTMAIDIHHIFPAAHCQKKGLDRQRWNSVVNKAPLSALTNVKLGGRAPSTYLATVEKDSKLPAARLDEILRSHLISPELLRADDFERFLVDRATSLLDMIEGAMGKKVAGRDADDVFKAFGAPLCASVLVGRP